MNCRSTDKTWRKAVPKHQLRHIAAPVVILLTGRACSIAMHMTKTVPCVPVGS